MLTQDQEALIAATAPVVAEHLNTITQRFYPLMFERYPSVKPLFNQVHQQNGAQPRALAGAVLAYVGIRQDPVKARETLETVVNKHVSLGILPEQYPIVGECLMMAIGEVLGDALTPEIADAWGALYQELADLLIDLEENRYQEFEQREGGWRGTRRFHVAASQQESAVIRSFILEPEDGGPVAAHAPGQYIGVKVTIDGEPVHRHYSLSATPNGRAYRVSIKRENDGRVSRYFHDQLANGGVVELLPPAGEMTLVPGEAPLMLISGGVGQTPLLPMAKQALGQGRRVVYLHAAQTPEHWAFADELRALEKAYPLQFTLVTVFEQSDAGDHQGRLNQALLADYLPEGAHCYFVGPHGMMEAVEQSLKQLGVADSHRHYEHFGPAMPLNAVSAA
ncbi:NO-inducible flavohemoprotein [Halomonas sp. CUBES01]|uniref:nitric oxide dioxygenase n=1 Tax=Vreelandella gomseomensis TaxID=370766 RepID=A0ABU1GE85_9GAMM|nr:MULTISPECIES: NO-inducible flavohemoprotein [Halomonas]MDR5875795.1 NO-inducible flavohemoprotein [Halomonas gomseomensis]MEC4768668.1 NO-inducible flavohemoprotein [Halomonas sp. CUBES01]